MSLSCSQYLYQIYTDCAVTSNTSKRDENQSFTEALRIFSNKSQISLSTWVFGSYAVHATLLNLPAEISTKLIFTGRSVLAYWQVRKFNGRTKTLELKGN